MARKKRILQDGMTCPVCGDGRLVRQVKAETVTYREQSKTIEGWESFHCAVCGEDYMDHQAIGQVEPDLQAHRQEVDGLLTPDEIRRIRQNLKVSQETFATVLGGGPKGFAKYEGASTTQSKAMDNLLRVVRQYPEVFRFLMEVRGVRAAESKGRRHPEASSPEQSRTQSKRSK